MKRWWFDLRRGFGLNEGGVGPILVVDRKRGCFYACFWTKWIAPRIYISREQVEIFKDNAP